MTRVADARIIERWLTELGPILPPEELAGLAPRIRAALTGIAEQLSP